MAGTPEGSLGVPPDSPMRWAEMGVQLLAIELADYSLQDAVCVQYTHTKYLIPRISV